MKIGQQINIGSRLKSEAEYAVRNAKCIAVPKETEDLIQVIYFIFLYFMDHCNALNLQADKNI